MFFEFLCAGFLTKSKVAQGLLHVECGRELRHHRYGDPSLKNNWEMFDIPLGARPFKHQVSGKFGCRLLGGCKQYCQTWPFHFSWVPAISTGQMEMARLAKAVPWAASCRFMTISGHWVCQWYRRFLGMYINVVLIIVTMMIMIV